MIAIIRIRGKVNIPKEIQETLNRLKIRRKYCCVILRERKEILGMVEKVRNYTAYGKIDKETLILLIKKRGKAIGKENINAEKIAEEFLTSKTEKKLNEFGIKPFFRLHPPLKGIHSKLHYPKGVLGDNKDKINELIRRML